MIQPGIANALAEWAGTDADRIQQLKDERDALVTGMLTGKPVATVTAATINGKSITSLPDLTASEKLTVLTDVLAILGETTIERPVITYATFSRIQR